MRIGYLTYGLDRAPTGIGRNSVELLKALKALNNGPEIVLLTTEREDKLGLWQQFEHHSLPGCYLLPGLLSLGNLAVTYATRRYKLDIIHDPNGVAPFLAGRARAKRLVTLYDAFAYVCPEEQNPLDNWRYRFPLPQAIRRTDKVITMSECSRQDLNHYLKLPADKITVIPGGVDPAFQPIPDSLERQNTLAHYGIKAPYILYVGAINARKNIARLFEAYARLRESQPEITLVVVGKRQWLTGEIDATLHRLKLEEQVHFTGYVADEDLPTLYSAAQVFVFPSLYEGFGLPPLEAMACGTPVVTSNVSSLPEVVGEAALKIDPHNVAELAAAIEQILTDRELAAELQSRGLKQASHFTWENAARQTLLIYEQLAGTTIKPNLVKN